MEWTRIISPTIYHFNRIYRKIKNYVMPNTFQKIVKIAEIEGFPPRLAQLVAAQCAHETANFTSNVFKSCNNLGGYKFVPGARWQEGACLTSPEGNAYAAYVSVEDSIHEQIDWIKRRRKENRFPHYADVRTPEVYARFLKECGYFGDTVENYSRGLQNALKKWT